MIANAKTVAGSFEWVSLEDGIRKQRLQKLKKLQEQIQRASQQAEESLKVDRQALQEPFTI